MVAVPRVFLGKRASYLLLSDVTQRGRLGGCGHMEAELVSLKDGTMIGVERRGVRPREQHPGPGHKAYEAPCPNLGNAPCPRVTSLLPIGWTHHPGISFVRRDSSFSIVEGEGVAG